MGLEGEAFSSVWTTEGFLNLDTVDFWGPVVLCHMASSVHGETRAAPLGFPHRLPGARTPSCSDNQKCLQTFAECHLGGRSHL